MPRSIAGCGVSHIGEVARSDGGVEKRYLIYDEQRERIENGISRFGTKIALYPSPLSHNTTGHGWGEGIKKTQRYLHRPVIILQKTASDEVPVFGYKCGVSVGKAGIGK